MIAVSALLVGHWAWSALAYHVAFFTRINPAAWLFAALFIAQAVLFFRVGVVQRRLSFAPWGNVWAPLAWGLIAYAGLSPHQRDRPSQPAENPDVRPSVPDDDLYGWRVDAGDAAVLELLGGSSDLGSNRRTRNVPAWGLRRRCVTDCRHCTGDLFGAANHAWAAASRSSRSRLTPSGGAS